MTYRNRFALRDSPRSPAGQNPSIHHRAAAMKSAFPPGPIRPALTGRSELIIIYETELRRT